MAEQYTDFFNPHNPDSRLYEDLLNESVGFYGINAYYLVRSSLSAVDVIFGDDPTKMFNQAFQMPMYIQTVDQFEGFEAISKFGLEVRKQARFLVMTRKFNQIMPNGFGRPREGDLVWIQNFKAFFEIKKADEEHIFYTFGDQDIYGFSLVCEKWNFDQARVNTGIDQIDTTAQNVLMTYEFNFSANGSGTFLIGERVTGHNTNAYATVSTWNKPTAAMNVNSINHVFSIGEKVIGQNSNAQWILARTNVRDSVNDNLDNNQDVANESNQILIFDPLNPFGEPQQ